MARFAIFFTFKGETVRAMMERPSDRAAVVGGMLDSVGGKLEAYYLMFGEHDGMVIGEVPDAASAATVSLAVSSTGAFAHIETTQLFDPGEMNDMLARAKDIAYTPPGA
jgi:uncharacterized protein with GYD domain